MSCKITGQSKHINIGFDCHCNTSSTHSRKNVIIFRYHILSPPISVHIVCRSTVHIHPRLVHLRVHQVHQQLQCCPAVWLPHAHKALAVWFLLPLYWMMNMYINYMYMYTCILKYIPEFQGVYLTHLENTQALLKYVCLYQYTEITTFLYTDLFSTLFIKSCFRQSFFLFISFFLTFRQSCFFLFLFYFFLFFF